MLFLLTENEIKNIDFDKYYIHFTNNNNKDDYCFVITMIIFLIIFFYNLEIN